MDGHKSEVLSINLSGSEFLQSEPDSEEAWALRDGLKEMNSRWERLSSSLEAWREELQRALMQCQVRPARTHVHVYAYTHTHTHTHTHTPSPPSPTPSFTHGGWLAPVLTPEPVSLCCRSSTR